MRALALAVALLLSGVAHAQFGGFPTAPSGGTPASGTSPFAIGTNLVLSASGLTAPRTFTFPDASDTVDVLGTAQTITGVKTFSTAPVFSATLASITALQFNGGGFSGGSVAMVGLVTKYNNQNTAGSGIPYLLASAQDVTSTGAATTLVTLASPTSGLYRVNIVISAHTNNDTVSATITYTDAVEAFATTLTPISSVALTHDSNTGTASSTTLIRASSATSIVCTMSVTTQTTTKGSCSIERLN